MGHAKLFNTDEIKEFFGDDEEILIEIYEDFKNDYQDMIQELEKSYAEQDFSALERHAHTLKGIFRNFFVHDLTEILQSLESQASKEQVIDFDQQLRKIKELSALFFTQFDLYITTKA